MVLAQKDQWKRTDSPKIYPHEYNQLIFAKGAKVIKWEKRQSFQKVVLEQLDIHVQKMNPDTDLTLYTKINSM